MTGREIIGMIAGYVVFLGFPIAILCWFVVSLVRFLRCGKENADKRRRRKKELILSSSVLGVLVIIIIALCVLLGLAVANM